MKTCAIVGFGCAGYHAAKALRQCDPTCRIDVYSDTDAAPANPMLTTYYVAGKIGREALFPFGDKESVVRELGVELFESTPVRRVDARELTVELSDGTCRRYDDIIIATGSYPLVPPIPGMPEKGVFVMRTPQDADRLLEAVRGGISSAMVIGASWVGIKVVEALRAHHVPATLADMAPRIFPTATMPQTAQAIHEHLEELGVGLLFGRGIASMREEEDGIVSVFTDGTQVKTDIVALCLGMRPAVACVDPEQVELGRGIRVDSRMATSAPHVYAAGDCCEAAEVLTGQYLPVNLWANAVQQGRIAGHNAAGRPDFFQGNFIHNITHFLDMDFIGLGDNRAQGEHLSYRSPDGWQMEMILREGTPACINILENRRSSGPLKAALLKRLASPGCRLDRDMVVALHEAGLPDYVIEKIGGKIS